MPLIAMVDFNSRAPPTTAVDWLGTNIVEAPSGVGNAEYLCEAIS
jgi:hypothetical protein